MQEENSKELWELVGDRWRLPIEVNWENDVASIALANIPLLEAQKRVAIETLEPLKNNEGEFVVSREVLMQHARRSKFTNPEDVVEWRHYVAPALHFKKDPLVDEFLDAYVAKGIVRDRATISAIYSTLCAHMLEWTLRGKPIPLIFATIYPFLYRGNWKELLHYIYAGRKRKMEDATFVTHNEKELIGVVTDPRARKCYDVKVAAWSLSIVPERMFHQYSSALEHRMREQERGPENYWGNVKSRIRKQLTYAYICYADFRKAAAQKSFAILRGGLPGPKKSYKRRKHYGSDGRLYSLEHLPFWRGKRAELGKCGAVERKNEGVPAMSSVQPETNDMRDVRENVPRSKAEVPPE